MGRVTYTIEDRKDLNVTQSLLEKFQWKIIDRKSVFFISFSMNLYIYYFYHFLKKKKMFTNRELKRKFGIFLIYFYFICLFILPPPVGVSETNFLAAVQSHRRDQLSPRHSASPDLPP